MSAVAQSASLASARSAFSGSRKSLNSTKTVRAARAVAAKAEVKEIHMPALSSTMTEGKIVSWLKGEGDAISKGDAVVVVESDKADMDVESFFDGYLAVIAVEDGEMATVGAPIAFVAETEAEIDAAKAAAAAAGGAAPAAPAAPAPEPVAEAPAAPAPAAAAPAPAAPAPAPAAPAAPAPAGRADGRIIATPYAKKLAKKLKVDLASVAGSGLNGRITAGDVEAKAGVPSSTAPAAAAPAAAAPAAAPAGPSVAAAAPAPLPAAAGAAVPLSGMQAAVAKNMLPSLSVPVSRIAMSMCTDELDALYKKVKPKGVTMTALLAKAVGVALAQHPIMFSALTPDGGSIVYNEKVNIAIAVALESGLITPVLPDTAGTDVYELGRVWSGLVKKARGPGLAPADYAGGNFTISNMGMFGVDAFDAILPPGQSCILAVGGSKPTVVPVDGMIGVKTMMTVNLTADHRHINGDVAATFLKTLKAVIEDPKDLVY
jgi:pyruvate dehydrogenase E2 component (dihydrolipoamide acetyltransferase)